LQLFLYRVGFLLHPDTYIIGVICATCSMGAVRIDKYRKENDMDEASHLALPILNI
jgi:hypothetical protein